jgi:hypothetical protein
VEVTIVGWRFREAIPVSWRRGGIEGPAVALEGVRVVGALWKRWAGRRSVIGADGRRVLSTVDRWWVAVLVLVLLLMLSLLLVVFVFVFEVV